MSALSTERTAYRQWLLSGVEFLPLNFRLWHIRDGESVQINWLTSMDLKQRTDRSKCPDILSHDADGELCL